jgi:transglutaminase-like putative cysteine protease
VKNLPLSVSGVVINTVAVWAAIAIAAVAWWPIYGVTAFIVLVIVAVLCSSAVAIAGAVFGWPSWAVIAASVGIFLTTGVALAVPSEAIVGVLPSAQGLLDLASGAVLGWKQLLTIALPVGSYQALLVPCLVMVIAATVTSLSLALRSRAGDRAAVPPAAFMIVGLAFGIREEFFPIPIALAELAAILVWLNWRRATRRAAAISALAPGAKRGRRFSIRAIVSAIMVLTIAGGAAAAAAIAAPPSADRAVLRDAIEQPFDPREFASPLAGFRQYLKGAASDTVLFTVTGLPAGQRIRIATLDTYDGIVYSVGSDRVSSASGSFTRVPLRIERPDDGEQEVAVDVEIQGYSGVWLPTVGSLSSVEFSGANAISLNDGFYFNDVTGTAADLAILTSGDSFTVTSRLKSQPTAVQLAGVTPGPAIVPELSDIPAETSTVLDEYTLNATRRGAKLVAMLDGLKRDGYISHGILETEPPSRSGHSADRINQLLTDQRMIGDAEQYAVTAAIMAQRLGFPSRVVFGFDPADKSGNVAVTGSMVSAWIEVDTAQFGWVTIDPNPPVREIPEELPEDPTTVSRPPVIVQPPIDQQEQPDAQTPAESQPDDPNAADEWLAVVLGILRVVGSVALVALILSAPFLLVIAAKLRRRSLRRRARSPLAQITGGWREFEDAVVDNGFEPLPSATRTELASMVGTDGGALAAVDVDRAVFSPSEPTMDDAERMWAELELLTSALSVGKTRWQRLRARISLRSFGAGSTPRAVRTLLTRRGSRR